MGGVASYVMCDGFPYNDLDILFNLNYSFQQRIGVSHFVFICFLFYMKFRSSNVAMIDMVSLYCLCFASLVLNHTEDSYGDAK